MNLSDKHIETFLRWKRDWNSFAYDVLKARLDKEQQAILESFQNNPLTVCMSGVSRGKDYVAACCALCFFYLTPEFDKDGRLVANTKVVLTAPTGRQVSNVMLGEYRRLFKNAQILPGRLVGNDIRMSQEEYFLTGFKADDNNMEAWSGMHAANMAFIVTEASGVPDMIFNAIEGNLQGNSRLLLVANPNTTVGYAANAMKSPRFKHFRLNSLNAENVVKKEIIYQGQVDYRWIADKLAEWCTPIQETEFNEGEGDFRFEGNLYRPNDLFRVKVLGMFPKVAEDVLVPYEWIELANQRWELYNETGSVPHGAKIISVDIAGMGRDSSVKCTRIGNYIEKLFVHQSAGKADHMHITGIIANDLANLQGAVAFIDTIGEGAACFSRLEELGYSNVVSAKFSYGANGLSDITGQYTFANQRAYCYWALRDWLNPKNGYDACLPPDDLLTEELTATRWKFRSDGSIIIEPKEDIVNNIRRSPDRSDAVALSFFPNGFVENDTYDDLIGML